ncbi:MAG: fused MFS/spermidine synthase [Akkermansiaceae bacterium]|nr:fused MFS/spermidine synthase [Akkermansiaceae bacterium]
MARGLFSVLFFLGGAAALAWQVLWQHRLSLALGATAQATALTVSTAMAGMTFGAWAMGRRARRWESKPVRWLWIYAALELAVAALAWLPEILGGALSKVDASLYQRAPSFGPVATLFPLALTLGPASAAMGATLPVAGMVARDLGGRLSRYYGLNTAGAALGTLGLAFWIAPLTGMLGAAQLATLANLLVAAAAFVFGWSRKGQAVPDVKPEPAVGEASDEDGEPGAAGYAFVTGVAVFGLEVAWFRALRAAWFGTTDSFAIMLFAILVALAAGAGLAGRIGRTGMSVPAILGIGGVLVLLATPVVERFDLFQLGRASFLGFSLARAGLALLVLGPPVTAIGVSLPMLLDREKNPERWGRLYAWNTAGAVLGATGTAWLLLPAFGYVPAAWLMGALLAGTALWRLISARARVELGLFAVAAAVAAWFFGSGAGRVRVAKADTFIRAKYRVIETRNGPESSSAVVESGGARALFIDGYLATAQTGNPRNYMDAMGRLPMLLHPAPRDGLVICFGTGQTANGMRDENPERLTVVDLNPAAFAFAGHFSANHGVLDDPRVRTRLMDGRQWLRRSPDRYDAIALEPMPPFFAGSNALYAIEFYEEAAARLNAGGLMAQWFPLHLMSPEDARAVAAAFQFVFPDAILWLDPASVGGAGVPEQGILIGRRRSEGEEEEETVEFWREWPGFARSGERRVFGEDEVRAGVWLTPTELRAFARGAEPVTDDNQLLAYGRERFDRSGRGVLEILRETFARLEAARNGR